jgi:hypothetical protein
MLYVIRRAICGMVIMSVPGGDGVERVGNNVGIEPPMPK